jgi:hypothetical protein
MYGRDRRSKLGRLADRRLTETVLAHVDVSVVDVVAVVPYCTSQSTQQGIRRRGCEHVHKKQWSRNA